MKTRPLFLLLLALASLSSSGCVTAHSAVTGQKRMYAYSWSHEVRLGRETDPELLAEFGLYEDSALTAYVARIGEAVLAHSHLRRESAAPEQRQTPFTFRVLDSPVVNAFALPGGYIYVTRGLLAHLENEAQLAVVLGHEVAHVAARHTSQRMLEAQIGMLAVIGASLLGERWNAGEAILGLGLAATQVVMLGHSRGHERESDRLGVEYAALAGYEAAEGAKFFTVLRRMQDRHGWFPTFLSSHPDPGQRERTIVEIAADWAPADGSAPRREVERYLATIDGITFGDDPRHGFVREGAFFHPADRFRFSAPPGWKIAHNRQRVVVSREPARGGTSEPQDAGLVLRRIADATSARAAAAQYLRTADSLHVLRELPDRVNGLTAYTLEAERRVKADTTRLILTFIEHERQVFLFGGIAPAAAFGENAAAFGRVIGSFAPLHDPRVLAVQPTRLRVSRAERDTRLRDLLPRELPLGVSADDIALLNHLASPDDVVRAGTPVKLPVAPPAGAAPPTRR
jgi:predicted Zn-dependent protease